MHIHLPNPHAPFDAPYFDGPLSEVADELEPGEYTGTSEGRPVMVTIWSNGDDAYLEFLD
jgi:hypothetical protein